MVYVTSWELLQFLQKFQQTMEVKIEQMKESMEEKI